MFIGSSKSYFIPRVYKTNRYSTMSANSAVINALQAGLERAKERHAAALATYKKSVEEVDDLIKAIAEVQSRELSTPQVVELLTPQVDELSTPQAVSQSTPQVDELSTPQAVSQSTPQVVSRSMAQAVSQSTPQAVSRSTPQAVSRSTPQAVSQSTPQAVSRSTALVPRSPVVDLSTLQVVVQDTSWNIVQTAQQSRTMCTVITNSMFEATSEEEATEVLYQNMDGVEIMPIQVLQTQKGDWKIKFAMPSSALKDVRYRYDHNNKKVWKFKDLEIRTFNPYHVPSYGRTNDSDNGSNGSYSGITLGHFF